MKNMTLTAAMAVILMLPTMSSADSWKEESRHGPGNNGIGHAYGHEKQKHKHKHKHKHDHDDDYHDHDRKVVYVYEDDRRDERPRREVERRTAIESGTCNRKKMGTILGGIVGGVVGYKVGEDHGDKRVGMVLGALAGAFAGNKIGDRMDEKDAGCTSQALEHARDGESIKWRNPDNGIDYKMTPVKSYQKNDLECRRFISEATLDKQQEQYEREACKQSDGVWEMTAYKKRRL